MVKKYKVIDNFISKEALSGIFLLFVTAFAIIVSNSSLSHLYFNLWEKPLGINLGDLSISMPLKLWINDGLMSLFFLMVSLEIKRELLTGELSSFSKAMFPFVGAIGGMVVPALIYISLNPDNYIGFGIPMGTDTAFAIAMLFLLGKRVSTGVKIFLVSLAVIDDLCAILVVAIVYTNELKLIYFVHAGIVYSFIWLLNYFNVKNISIYFLLGIVLWIFIHETGVHATISGVLLAFAIPITSKMKEKKFIEKTRADIDEFEKNIDSKAILNSKQINALEGIAYGYDRVQNPLVRLEHNMHGFSAFFIMPIFAFSNAGVLLNFSTFTEHWIIVLGVGLGLLIGKPIGILGFTFIASRIGLIKKPKNVSWFEVISIGFIAGIGFTMSIFIANLAFIDESIVSAVKIGIFIASFFATIIGMSLMILSYNLKHIRI